MSRLTGFLFALALSLVNSSCASVSAERMEGADLVNLGAIYVAHYPDDNIELHRKIKDQLRERGFEASWGELEDMPSGTQTLVTYEDRWMWDITMYLLDLTINVRNAETDDLLATGHSYRPSLQRVRPETMIREVLDEILSDPTAEEIPEE